MSGWKPGDRVIVHLPENRRKAVPASGTVREVDPAGLRPGVRVDLDREVNGIRTCYATHAELMAEPCDCPTPTSAGSKWKPGSQHWTCRCGKEWRWLGRPPLDDSVGDLWWPEDHIHEIDLEALFAESDRLAAREGQ